MNRTWIAVVSLLFCTPAGAAAEESVEQSAKQAQNPVANIVKVQFQNYLNYGVGANQVVQYLQNVIVSIPFQLTGNWNLITRTNLPMINQPSIAPGVGSAFGAGDLNPTLYLSPRKPARIKWGLGPTFVLRTASDSILGSGKWCAGPAAVVLVTPGHWVVGTRISNQWSYAGGRRQGINEFWLQPFVHYNLPRGWYLATLPTITANWKASSGNVWTVPLGGGSGKQWRLNEGWSIDGQVQAFSAVKHPAGAADRQFFFQVQLVHRGE